MVGARAWHWWGWFAKGPHALVASGMLCVFFLADASAFWLGSSLQLRGIFFSGSIIWIYSQLRCRLELVFVRKCLWAN